MQIVLFEYPVDINHADIDEIMISSKVLSCEKGFQYFIIGYKNEEELSHYV